MGLSLKNVELSEILETLDNITCLKRIFFKSKKNNNIYYMLSDTLYGLFVVDDVVIWRRHLPAIGFFATKFEIIMNDSKVPEDYKLELAFHLDLFTRRR